MAINRANLAKQLEPGLDKVFGLEYNGVDNEHQMFFATDKSNRSFEERQNMALFDTAPV